MQNSAICELELRVSGPSLAMQSSRYKKKNQRWFSMRLWVKSKSTNLVRLTVKLLQESQHITSESDQGLKVKVTGVRTLLGQQDRSYSHPSPSVNLCSRLTLHLNQFLLSSLQVLYQGSNQILLAHLAWFDRRNKGWKSKLLVWEPCWGHKTAQTQTAITFWCHFRKNLVFYFTPLDRYLF